MLNKILLFISFMAMLSSCTEVITLNYNSSVSQIVVEGKVPEGERAIVRLTKSINFITDSVFPPVQNAVVTLSDNRGNSEVLIEKKPGIYISNSIRGVSGRTYSISIVSDEKTITSVCKIPTKVPFDSLKITQSFGYTRSGFGGSTKIDTLYQLEAMFADPVEEKNYYRFEEYENGVLSDNTYTYDDRLTNGKKVDRNLFSFSRKLKKGDTVTVEMQCIQKEVFDYFDSFGNNRMGSSTPANPYTNLKGAVLGYFSAYTVERKQIVLK